MMTTESNPTDLKLAKLRAIATSETQPIHDRQFAAEWILCISPHHSDHALARAVLADLETIAQIEVIQ